MAFKKSLLFFVPSAIRNPLIYLNYAIFCYDCLKDDAQAQQYLYNFYNLCESVKVPIEYVRVADKLNLMLPDTLPLPETKIGGPSGRASASVRPIETIEENVGEEELEESRNRKFEEEIKEENDDIEGDLV